jgi:hypothetical protein
MGFLGKSNRPPCRKCQLYELDRKQLKRQLVGVKDAAERLTADGAKWRALAEYHQTEIEYLRASLREERLGPVKANTEEEGFALALAAERMAAEKEDEEQTEKVPSSGLNDRINEVFMDGWRPEVAGVQIGNIFTDYDDGEEGEELTETQDGDERQG